MQVVIEKTIGLELQANKRVMADFTAKHESLKWWEGGDHCQVMIVNNNNVIMLTPKQQEVVRVCTHLGHTILDTHEYTKSRGITVNLRTI